jgi:hypothetical protein
MVSDVELLKEFIESETLKAASEEVCKSIGTAIYPRYSEQMFESLLVSFNEAHISVEQLKYLFNLQREKFLRYVKRVYLSTNFEKTDEEFPPGYDPTDDDFSKLVKVLGVSKDFLIRYLIDFSILDTKQDDFERFLKATRTPNAKKQSAKLRKIFRDTSA